MQTILYTRVSTAEQTLAHQRIQAEAAGYSLDQVIADHGLSGVTTRLVDRPEGKRLFDMLRTGDTLIVRWVDRLGRDYRDVSDTIREFMQRGVIVRTIIHGLVFDGATKDPMQQAVRDALIGFMAATAQAQAEANREAQKAGIAHAHDREDAYLGRKPSYDRARFEEVATLLGRDTGISSIAKQTGLSRQAIYRIRDERAGVEAALARWGI